MIKISGPKKEMDGFIDGDTLCFSNVNTAYDSQEIGYTKGAHLVRVQIEIEKEPTVGLFVGGTRYGVAGEETDIIDDDGAVVHTGYSSFKKGEVKNPYYPSVAMTGFVGQGPYKTKVNGDHPIEYSIWATMIHRCYSPNVASRYPAYYKKATVCEEWKNYQNFAKWYGAHKYDVQGRLHLDKDIIFPGNTIYAPDRCLLVPQRINMLFMSGTGKMAGYSQHIIDVANEYKETIPVEVYQALIKRAKEFIKEGFDV